ncbi:MAG: hypothetical protein OEY06_13155 [Gammaproteobacteria bacterium]|nr:hypothetical protein [Gammaproteobacteria bacterium]
MSEIHDFLKPESTAASGAAGGIIMTVASTLYAQFDIDPRICALVLSALISFSVIYKIKEIFPLKMIYMIVNTVVIFSVSVGSNTLVSKAPDISLTLFLPDIIPSAYAHDSDIDHVHDSVTSGVDDSIQDPSEMQRVIDDLKQKQAELESKLKEKNALSNKKSKRSFTDSWY